MCGPTEAASRSAPVAEPWPSKRYLTPQEQTSVKELVGNAACFDCGADRPQWCSVSYGIMLCNYCAGTHRSYGVHLSFVRSVELDAWRRPELEAMLLGGNGQMREFLAEEALDPDGLAGVGGAASRRQMYEGAAAQRYRRELAERSGRPVPPELPHASGRGATDREVDILGPRGREAAAGGAECSRRQRQQPQQRYQLAPTPARALPLSATQRPAWAADSDRCMLCSAAFTVFFRRHHCRRCGKCVCSDCAPKRDSRPIPEWNVMEPVRHCSQCACLALLHEPEHK